MNKTTLCFRFLASLGLLLVLSGCQSNSNSTESRHKAQVLTLNIFSEPPTLDPGLASDNTSSNLIKLLFDGLLNSSEEGPPTPAVAESYEVSQDGKTYTFHLRPTQWSNGDPVTSHDFAFAWKRALRPDFPADYAFYFYHIVGAKAAKEGKASLEAVGIKTPNDRTLVITLIRPVPYFVELLVLPPFIPLHQASVENHPNWALEAGPNYISNGPFKLDQWDHHKEIILERNPNYWDIPQIKLNKVVVYMVQDTNTELALFEKGSIDFTGKPISMGIPADSLNSFRDQGKLEHGHIAATYCFPFNTKKPPFNNVKMRQAFAYAINRQEIVDNITKDGEKVATCLVPPPLQLQATPCFVDGDVKTARRLFQEALKEMGITKEKLPPIVLSYNTGEGHHKIAQAIQQQWQEAFGIRVGLENLEWKVYLDKLTQGDFTIARMSWTADYNDPYSLLDMFQYDSGQINYSRWSDPKVNKLMTASLDTREPVQRRDLLRQAESRLINQMPAIPIYYLTSSYMRHPDLKGISFSPTGEISFRHAYFAVP